MKVYKSPTCGCCTAWVEHLEANAFEVTVRDIPDVSPIKARYGVPASVASCHTGLVEGYAIEGHVPADLVTKLLKERPRAVGLAVLSTAPADPSSPTTPR